MSDWESRLAAARELAAADVDVAASDVRAIEEEMRSAISGVRDVIAQTRQRIREDEHDRVRRHLAARDPLPTAKAAAESLGLTIGRVAKVHSEVLNERRIQKHIEWRRRVQEVEDQRCIEARQKVIDGDIDQSELSTAKVLSDVKRGDFLEWERVDGGSSDSVVVPIAQPSYTIALDDATTGNDTRVYFVRW